MNIFKQISKFIAFTAYPGIVCVLLGGMLGSVKGHKVSAQFFESKKIPSGFILLQRGQTENAVISSDSEKIAGLLNFELTATDIWIQRYGNGEIKDFKSALTVTKQGKPILKKTIEVNKPLHYGGYHFYQSGFDMENQRYTILSVVSDSGLKIVYCGYWLIIAGVFTKFWIEPIINYFKQRGYDGD